jgi:hypothetical protein
MKTLSVKSYPKEGMAAAYKQYEDVVKQLVYYSEDYGFFTLIKDRWYPIASGDESLTDLSLVDIDKESYKTVRDLYTKSEATKKPLRYEDIEKYRVEYVVKETITAAVESSEGCPPATKDISINLKNRKNAIDTAMYGPLNPNEPNNEYWQAIAAEWSVDIETAKKQRCGNCAVFIQTPKMLDCIASGLGNEEGNDAWGSIEAGDLGYCEAFDFKCASSRTCRAWVAGGPVTEEK